MRVNSCAALVVLLVAPALTIAPRRVLADEGPVLRRVNFISDSAVDEGALRALLRLSLGERVSGEALEEARRRLDAKGIFREIEFELVPAPGGAVLRVHLKREMVLGAVTASGYDHLGRTQIRRLMRLRSGSIFDARIVEAARQRVLDQYAKMGFPAAAVDVETEMRDGEVDVAFEIVEGSPVVVEKAVVDGEGAVAKTELEAAVNNLVGQNLTSDGVRAGERDLVRLLRDRGYYDARVRGSAAKAMIRYSVHAGPRFIIEISGNSWASRKWLLDLIDLRDRLIITDGTWRELARRVRSAYRDAGYYRAEVGVGVGDGDPKRVSIKIVEGRRYDLDRIEFAGNQSFSARELQRRMETQPGRWFPWPRRGVVRDDTLEEDRRRIEAFYRQAGFESAHVATIEVLADDRTGRIILRVAIREGPRTVVRAVDVEGLAALEKSRRKLRVRLGDPFDAAMVKADRLLLLREFKRLGYGKASLEVSVDRGPAGGREVPAKVTYRAILGAQEHVGAVIVQGNIDTRDSVVLRELPFVAGDPLAAAALRKGEANVYGTGLFRTVSVLPLPGQENRATRDVGVRVTERQPGRLEWGVGFNTRDGIGGFTELGYDNLNGMARKASVRGQVTVDPTDMGSSQFLASVAFRDPRLAGSPWRFSTNLLAERSTRGVDQFSLERTTLTTGVDRHLSSSVTAGIEFQVERSRVFDVAKDAQLTNQDVGRLRTIALSPFLVYDGRDSAFAPRRGVFDSVRLRYGLPELSTVHFARVSVRHTQHIPLPGGMEVLYALRGGWVGGLGGGNDVPIRERFFLGGRSTVRGFSENSVGPEGEGGNPIGGDLTLNTNMEFRFPIFHGFGGAIFFDAGGVYLLQLPSDVVASNTALSLDNFRRSAGFGLRYMTPVGPLSLDYGIKLDRRHDESFGAVHFNVGTVF